MPPIPRLYPILDTASLLARGCDAAAAARALLDAGVGILQFRHKGPFTRAAFRTAENVAALCRDYGALFIVDDRADIAMLLGGGVHLGQDDLPPAAARQLAGDETTIGFSTHNEAQLRAASGQPADYVALGPVFATGSKANPDPVVGTAGVRRLRALTAKPLVAIGGIDAGNAAEVLAAGADSVAVINALLPGACTPASIRRAAEILLAATR